MCLTSGDEAQKTDRAGFPSWSETCQIDDTFELKPYTARAYKRIQESRGFTRDSAAMSYKNKGLSGHKVRKTMSDNEDYVYFGTFLAAVFLSSLFPEVFGQSNQGIPSNVNGASWRGIHYTFTRPDFLK